MNIKQIRLTDGSELMVEIVDNQTDTGDFVVRNPLRIERVDDIARNQTVYLFRPYMVYQINKEQRPIVVNGSQVVAMALPDYEFAESYLETVKTYIESDGELEEDSETLDEYFDTQADSSFVNVFDDGETVVH
jgi:hypothetical protein